MQRHKLFPLLLFVFLLTLASFPTPTQATPDSETRYFHNLLHTINAHTAYKLWATPGIQQICSAVSTTKTGLTWYVGIRAWKVAENGDETEIQLDSQTGTPKAVVSIGSGVHYVSATVDVSQTSLEITDAIFVKVYYKRSDVGVWSFNWEAYTPFFITEQLGATQLDSATWTVYYVLAYYGGDGLYFWWGQPTGNQSKITNFSWSSGITQYDVTFYFHGVGVLLVNGTNTANETTSQYDENTILNITAVPGTDYVFKNHTYDSTATENNPFYLAVVQNFVVHTYFEAIPAFAWNYGILAGECAFIVNCALVCSLIFIVKVRREKNGY